MPHADPTEFYIYYAKALRVEWTFWRSTFVRILYSAVLAQHFGSEPPGSMIRPHVGLGTGSFSEVYNKQQLR